MIRSLKVNKMQIGRILNATRVLGKSQGYMGLPLRDEIINCSGCECLKYAWLVVNEVATLFRTIKSMLDLNHFLGRSLE